MKAVLHIGTHKTGTTTIQSFLGANREKLRKQGIFLSERGVTCENIPGSYETFPKT